MIYFVLSRLQDAVKIGYVEDRTTIEETAQRLRSRVSGIKTGNPYPLTLIGLIDGNYIEEQALHKEFQEVRLLGEWFTYTSELKEFISQNSNQEHIDKYEERIRKESKPKKRKRKRKKPVNYALLDECVELAENSYTTCKDLKEHFKKKGVKSGWRRGILPATKVASYYNLEIKNIKIKGKTTACIVGLKLKNT